MMYNLFFLIHRILLRMNLKFSVNLKPDFSLTFILPEELKVVAVLNFSLTLKFLVISGCFIND